MGKPKYIYLQDALHEKLSKEDNASALISGLLDNYYSKLEEGSASDVEKDVMMAQKIEDRKRELELLQEEYNDLIRGIEERKFKELEELRSHAETLELNKQWAEEVRKIPEEKRIKFKDWLKEREKAQSEQPIQATGAKKEGDGNDIK